MPHIGIVLGSKSDEPYFQEALRTLEELGIEYELQFLSAHRHPDKVREYASKAATRGIEVLIAGAGGAAALPGVLASWTSLPVIGVPLPTSELKGLDSLYAIVQMPPGVPVACMSIGAWGARNAVLFAAQILSLKHDSIRKAYEAYRAAQRER
ncbi:MAG: 5-(carboxyamino)imidazole ribonucleotide mutase [Chloroflexi bacterium]|nr:5-(carboxyamino)imidazole ribonucleotide mutase [Chloroflexota bacterium]